MLFRSAICAIQRDLSARFQSDKTAIQCGRHFDGACVASGVFTHVEGRSCVQVVAIVSMEGASREEEQVITATEKEVAELHW